MPGKLFATIGRKPRIAGGHDEVAGLLTAVESGYGCALVSERLVCLTGPRLQLIAFSNGPSPDPVIAIGCGDNHMDPCGTNQRRHRAGP